MGEFKKQVEGFATRAIHVEQETESWSDKQVVQPIVTTAIFRQIEPDTEQVSECILDLYKSNCHYSMKPHFYSRYGNPTRSLLEKCLASLDGGKYGLAFSSGQGAISSVTTILQSGDHILCAEGIYSGTPELISNLKKKGIDFNSVDFTDLNNVRQGIKSNTRVGVSVTNLLSLLLKVLIVRWFGWSPLQTHC